MAAALGTLRLLAHWASRTDVKVPEDELLAELRGGGADEWEQAIADAERTLRELTRQYPEKGPTRLGADP